jgi:uncharacterized protein YbcI
MTPAKLLDSDADILASISRYHREQQGIVPETLVVNIVANLVIVRSQGIFTPNELALLTEAEGRKLVATARREHRSLTRDAADNAIRRATGFPVLRSYYDLDIRVGQQIEVYELDLSATQ